MITIKSLLKIYQSKNKKLYRALNDVDLTLPDNGLVFLLGKSGSGKSTFLNILGGLDSSTSGNIVLDEKDLFGMKKSELTSYRSTDVGFIFQDYCLIDELTVYDNIAIALKPKASRSIHNIETILETMGLHGYGEKYPTELSGGERQRVAIARAIIKNPRIILADEPTGNLDSDATNAIFRLLKNLSKERLILVVSHDEASARAYADRIIVLENSQVVSDELNDPVYNGDIAKNGESAFFEPHNDVFNPRKEKVHHVGKRRIGWLFLKSKYPKIGLYSFMVALIMIVLMLAQTITAFDSAKVMKEAFESSKPDSVFLTKTLDGAQREQVEKLSKVANSFPSVSDSDIKTFRDNGYEGEICPVFKSNINIRQSQVSAGMTTTIFDKSLYVTEPLGTMVVDEAFLADKYGKLEYVAQAKEFHPTGVIITDYLADIMLESGQLSDADSYEDLIGEYRWGSDDSSRHVSRGYINGVVHTGYRDKYQEIFDKVEKYGSDYIQESLEDDNFLHLVDDIHTKYGLCYSLNPNYEQDVLEHPSWDMVWHYALRFEDGDFFTTDVPQIRRADSYGKELAPNEVLMEMTTYNKIFNKEYTAETLDEFEPHTESLRHHLYSELNEEDAQFVCDVTIAGLFISNQTGFSGTFIAGEDIYDLFAKSHVYPIGLYFDNGGDMTKVIDIATEAGFQHNLIVGESVRTMTKVVEVFVPVFRIMALILSIAIVFILMNFSSKMIHDKMKEIGILKAIGKKDRNIGAIFGMQILLIFLVTAVLSVSGYALFVSKVNDLLVNSLQTLSSGKMIHGLTFLSFSTDIVIWNVILILVLTLISYVVPMIKIRRLDPVKIIRIEK